MVVESWVYRTYECDAGHRWKVLVQKDTQVPANCTICAAEVPPEGANFVPITRSDLPAPHIAGSINKAIQTFEDMAFKRPHFPDGRPLLTNLKDNVKVGESYAVPRLEASNPVKMAAAMNPGFGFQPTAAAQAPSAHFAKRPRVGLKDPS